MFLTSTITFTHLFVLIIFLSYPAFVMAQTFENRIEKLQKKLEEIENFSSIRMRTEFKQEYFDQDNTEPKIHKGEYLKVGTKEVFDQEGGFYRTIRIPGQKFRQDPYFPSNITVNPNPPNNRNEPLYFINHLKDSVNAYSKLFKSNPDLKELEPEIIQLDNGDTIYRYERKGDNQSIMFTRRDFLNDHPIPLFDGIGARRSNGKIQWHWTMQFELDETSKLGINKIDYHIYRLKDTYSKYPSLYSLVNTIGLTSFVKPYKLDYHFQLNILEPPIINGDYDESELGFCIPEEETIESKSLIIELYTDQIEYSDLENVKLITP